MLLTIASVTCLATNIYFEARSEDRVGQYAVAEAWSQALSIAANAIDDYEIEDMRIFRQTVLYYHSKSVTPYWSKSMRQVGVIGSHIFYEAG